jgi:hypothetical protein
MGIRLTLVLAFVSLAFGLDFTELPVAKNNAYWQRLALTSPREQVDLSGVWKFEVDGEEGNQSSVKVPSLSDYEGLIRYRRPFVLEEQHRNKFYYLVLEGISQRATVRINGQYIAALENPYARHRIAVSGELLLYGKENIIELDVDSRYDYNYSIPVGPKLGVWNTGNGIHRELYLEVVHPVHMNQVKTFQTFNRDFSDAQLWSKVMLFRSPQYAQAGPDGDDGYIVEVALFKDSALVAQKQSFDIKLGNQLEWETTLSLTVNNVEKWEPDNPALYQQRISVYAKNKRRLLDRQWQTIGFREFKIVADRFFLNGKRFTIKGIDYPQFFPGYQDMVIFPVIEKDFAHIKTLGVNTITSGGRPLPETVLEIADRLGLVILQEFQAYYTPASKLNDDDFLDKAGKRFQQMVIDGRNHPSVVAWGIGRNFDASSPAATDYWIHLRSQAKALDNRPFFLTTQLPNAEKLGYSLDFILVDAFFWKNDKRFFNNIRRVKNRYPGKPVVIAGIGKIVQPGNNKGTLNPISEESQAALINVRLRMVYDSGLATGAIVSAYSDYETEIPNTFAQLTGNDLQFPVGVVDLQRKERPAAQAVQYAFREDRNFAFRTGEEPTSPGFLYIGPAILNLLLGLIIYRNSNRFKENLKRSLAHPFGFFSDIRDRRIIPLPQSIWLVIIIGVNWAIFYSSILYHLRFSVLFDYWIGVFLPFESLIPIISVFMWEPHIGIPILTLVVIAIFFITGLMVRFISFFTRIKITMRQATSLAFWSTTNFAIMVPFSVFFFSLFEYQFLTEWLLLIWAVFHLWFALRVINGTRVLLNVPYFNIFMVFLFFTLFFGSLYFLTMQNAYHSFDFLPLFDKMVL